MVYGVSVGYPALSVHLCQTMGAVVSSSRMLLLGARLYAFAPPSPLTWGTWARTGC
nr:MAG TPA: hypothetical protein [Caudoviricetes sp.]